LPTEDQSDVERISVPYTLVSTYTPRESLSQELIAALKKPLGGVDLAHGATVLGLGGTGKTQLVLQYVETYRTGYDSVLWLDVKDQETARSSFERCCHQLRLTIGHRTETKTLKDSTPVRKLLHWLSSRKEGQRWLVVVNNADDLTWGVRALIPKGRVGTVIVTSHDRDASASLGGKSGIIKVDAMTSDESCSLLIEAIGFGCQVIEDDTRALLGTIVEKLDRLPLAIDLAGRRIHTEASSRAEPNGFIHPPFFKRALLKYLSDLSSHRRELLKGTEITCTSPYQKTVWTVWETSLDSLRRFERYRPDQLLHLMARLNGTCIQTALFRHASSDFRAVCDQLGIKAPSWLEEILRLRDNGDWDDFVYRETVDILERFGLVRIIHEPDPGVTMHGLVSWRAAEDATSPEEWKWFLVFLVAVCSRLLKLQEEAPSSSLELRRHILIHLPTIEDLTGKKTHLPDEALVRAWMEISSLLEKEGKWQDCEHLHQAVFSLQENSLGSQHTTTRLYKDRLAAFRVRQETHEIAQRTITRGNKHPVVSDAPHNPEITARLSIDPLAADSASDSGPSLALLTPLQQEPNYQCMKADTADTADPGHAPKSRESSFSDIYTDGATTASHAFAADACSEDNSNVGGLESFTRSLHQQALALSAVHPKPTGKPNLKMDSNAKLVIHNWLARRPKTSCLWLQGQASANICQTLTAALYQRPTRLIYCSADQYEGNTFLRPEQRLQRLSYSLVIQLLHHAANECLVQHLSQLHELEPL
jgi:hypothetical protein